MMLGHSNFFSMVGEALSLFRENKLSMQRQNQMLKVPLKYIL